MDRSQSGTSTSLSLVKTRKSESKKDKVSIKNPPKKAKNSNPSKSSEPKQIQNPSVLKHQVEEKPIVPKEEGI